MKGINTDETNIKTGVQTINQRERKTNQHNKELKKEKEQIQLN